MPKKGNVPWNKGREVTEEFREKMRQVNKGKVPPKRKGATMSVEARRKISLNSKQRGSLNRSWKGGITPINEKIRKSLDYKLWREAVFARDSWTCVFCKVKGGRLNADHIKPFCLYPELRFAIDNGRTLCVPCHKTTDTYGSKALKYHEN